MIQVDNGGSNDISRQWRVKFGKWISFRSKNFNFAIWFSRHLEKFYFIRVQERENPRNKIYYYKKPESALLLAKMAVISASELKKENVISSSEVKKGKSKKSEKDSSPAKRNSSPGIRLVGNRIYDSVDGKSCHQVTN